MNFSLVRDSFVQTAVDTKHHLIVAHEVTNQGSDRQQLANMAKRAKSVFATEALTAVADRGYYRGEDILECEKANISSYLPKPQTSGNNLPNTANTGCLSSFWAPK